MSDRQTDRTIEASETKPEAEGLGLEPRTILLLGTDAAGKNHVAEVWARRLAEHGLDPVVQEGWLAASPEEAGEDEEKSRLAHLAEGTFLRVFPLIAWMMPMALRFLLRRDVRRFRPDGRCRLVVSHSALRILAFCLGARGRSPSTLSEPIRQAVRDLRSCSNALVIVLDVDHDVRRRRIEARLDRGGSDPFDRYMVADAERSEHIEACLVELATELLGAHLVVNDNLDDDTLWNELIKAWRTSTAQSDSAAGEGSPAR